MQQIQLKCHLPDWTKHVVYANINCKNRKKRRKCLQWVRQDMHGWMKTDLGDRQTGRPTNEEGFSHSKRFTFRFSLRRLLPYLPCVYKELPPYRILDKYYSPSLDQNGRTAITQSHTRLTTDACLESGRLTLSRSGQSQAQSY